MYLRIVVGVHDRDRLAGAVGLDRLVVLREVERVNSVSVPDLCGGQRGQQDQAFKALQHRGATVAGAALPRLLVADARCPSSSKTMRRRRFEESWHCRRGGEVVPLLPRRIRMYRCVLKEKIHSLNSISNYRSDARWSFPTNMPTRSWLQVLGWMEVPRRIRIGTSLSVLS